MTKQYLVNKTSKRVYGQTQCIFSQSCVHFVEWGAEMCGLFALQVQQ